MKPVAVQFARRANVTGWLGRVGFVIGLVAAAASATNYAIKRMELERIAAAVDEAATTVRRHEVANRPREAPVLPNDKVRAINTAIGQLNLPWAQLFAAFEEAKPETVALISFEPDGKKRTLVVQAESKTPEHMIEFVDRLKQVPMFEDAFLTKHEIRDQDPNRPYRFAVELRWKQDV